MLNVECLPVAEQWIVRVHGKEYGPVDLDELRAWRQDGRLIRENEIREAGSERWFRAAELPEVFGDEATSSATESLFVRRMSFGEMFRASWRIYAGGFWRFFTLALLVWVPLFFLQVVAPYLYMPENK